MTWNCQKLHIRFEKTAFWISKLSPCVTPWYKAIWLKKMSTPMKLRSLSVSSTLGDMFIQMHVFYLMSEKYAPFIAKWTPDVLVDFWQPYWCTTVVHKHCSFIQNSINQVILTVTQCMNAILAIAFKKTITKIAFITARIIASLDFIPEDLYDSFHITFVPLKFYKVAWNASTKLIAQKQCTAQTWELEKWFVSIAFFKKRFQFYLFVAWQWKRCIECRGIIKFSLPCDNLKAWLA